VDLTFDVELNMTPSVYAWHRKPVFKVLLSTTLQARTTQCTIHCYAKRCNSSTGP